MDRDDTREERGSVRRFGGGCRGRLRLALLPLAALDAWATVASAWLSRHAALELAIATTGVIDARIGDLTTSWRCESAAVPWDSENQQWRVTLAPPPLVAVFGAGPETPLLAPMLHTMGWQTRVIERRPRWLQTAGVADTHLDLGPNEALAVIGARIDAALVMHHNFERDRDALAALAAHPVPFIGLLGPDRRREDLFRVLAPAQRDAVLPRLHSPVGLRLGGDGPEAIALSIAAQLQAWWHSK